MLIRPRFWKKVAQHGRIIEDALYIVFLRAHPVHGESHIQRNATGEVATTSLKFTTNRTNRTFFSVKAEH